MISEAIVFCVTFSIGIVIGELLRAAISKKHQFRVAEVIDHIFFSCVAVMMFVFFNHDRFM